MLKLYVALFLERNHRDSREQERGSMACAGIYRIRPAPPY